MPPTFLGITKGWRAALVIGLAAAGLAIGWFLPPLVGWALGLPWVPFSGPLRLLDSAPEPWLALGAATVGLLAGGGLGIAAIVESLAVTVTDRQVELRIKRTTRTFARGQIGAVYLDGKSLVLLGAATEELAREKHESSARELEAGFAGHGYPWAGTDPHQGAYRLWVPDLPGLPDGVNALLQARARALDKKQADEAEELRREVGRLGIVVREENRRQYWRKSVRA
jgi:hypothetical protein